MENAFRGVVRGGCLGDEGTLALVVSHPHPDDDHGGGPGPVEDWNAPDEPGVYAALVDSDFDPEDVTFEVDGFRHVALCTAGRWTLEELPGSGTIDRLSDWGGGRHGALLSYGGSAFFAAIRAGEGVWEGLEYAGVPAGLVETRACFSGEDVVLAGSRSFEPDAPSDERWGGQLSVADAEHVYRVDDSGFERCAIPRVESVGNLPTVGGLFVGKDRLWLAGSHVLASSTDGRTWTTQPVR